MCMRNSRGEFAFAQGLLAVRVQPDSSAGRARGFNLVELLMSMALATIIFMAITTLFVKQTEVMQEQNELIVLNREARFGLDHLRTDLTSLGSNSTPNSAVDPSVCIKPATQIRALTVDTTVGYVAASSLNANIEPTALTLFGSLDIKTRYRSQAISGSTVTLLDDGKLPVDQAAWDETFATDRFLRISGADGQQMFFAIASGNQSSKTVTVADPIPRVTTGSNCGYTGLGVNYNIDVQNFVRYRVVADIRPGAPLDVSGKALQGLLVRERMNSSGTSVKNQLVLVENAIDLQIYDIGFDIERSSEKVKFDVKRLAADVFVSGGGGLLGNLASEAMPEALRFVTIKLSVRTTWPRKGLVHRPRDVSWEPLTTYLLPNELDGSHPVMSVASRVAFPTLVSRNL
ncbi:MAG: prepilin-type N-terminal cleavage/methylation domain-containing protein [Myxococcales bacterium]|nr:prepilin-type N-terminal cleavage/methylation domain-containing protein [Myxococcales bacterium]